MKRAMNAKQPGEKLYHMERIHSKLIHLVTVDGVLDDIKEFNGNTILIILNHLKESLDCFNIFGVNKQYIKYRETIEQAIAITGKYDSSNKSSIKKSFCLMYGAFTKYRRVFKKRIKKLCEYEFQYLCVPMFYLDKTYIKDLRIKNRELGNKLEE